MLKKTAFLTSLFFLSLQYISAHPHMGLNSRCVVHWEGERIAGVELEWDFDKYFSADVIYSFDLDSNGIFDENELKEIYQFAFSNLENFNYFTFFRAGDERFTPERIENFNAWYKDRVVTYSFYIPLDDFYERELYVSVYDFSFFCLVEYDEDDPVRLNLDPAQIQAGFSIEENRDYPVYYDPFAPMTDMTVYDSWHPGLETFYPEEIHIVF
ncbi:MAG: DUF1007 family protein [Spirochaetales bacterium]|nr:DUF1007 family protein [Spirochaetales bacterium]